MVVRANLGLRCPWAGAAALSAALCTGAAGAETLRQALIDAYTNNPSLNQQRAEQRSTDEQVPQAKAGLRPSIGVSLTGVYNRTYNALSFLTPPQANNGAAALTASQPIYTGGRTAAAVAAAEQTVYAGREGLRLSEAQILTAAVQAYESVRRDLEALEEWRDDVSFLERQVEEISARKKVGDVTRTDVAQANVQLLDSRASLAEAQGQLEMDNATYVAVIGHAPGQLQNAPALPGLPASIEAAFDMAEDNNPALSQAKRNALAAAARVKQAEAAGRPTITLQASFGSDGALVPAYARQYERTVQGSAVINQPIFAGGQIASGVRQAKAEENAQRIGIEVVRRNTIQATSQAWSQMLASQQDLDVRAAEVVAAEATLEGQRQEYRIGQRSTLEVLVAEQTLRDTRLAAINARYQLYIAQTDLLNAVGRLEIRYLAPEAPIYDPAKPYRAVKDRGGTPWDAPLRALDGAFP